MNKTIRKHTAAIGSMLAGSMLVFGTVVMINRFADGPDASEAIRAAAIDFQKKEQKPQAKKVEKKEQPPKRTRSRTAPTPLTGLSTGLSGIDLGLPAFDTDLGGLSSDLLGDVGDVVMSDDSVDVPPQPTQQGPMQYPVRAKAKGVEGYVVLTLLIGPTGEVEKVKVLEAQPPGVFDEVASTGVRNWKFEPAMYQGESVRVWAKQKVRFDLG